MPVEHGKLIDKSSLAGADVICLLGILGQDGEGGLVLAYGLLTLGIAPLGQLQQGVVEVEALHLVTSTNSSRSDLLAISPAFSGNTIFE